MSALLTKMSNYSFSEEGSEATADEELLRDLDNLREVLEEDDLAGSCEEEGNRLSSLAERPLEGLKLCLQKNHENQVLLKWLLKKIDKALETNQVKREDSAHPSAAKRKKFTFWKFYRGSYFKDHRGKSAPSSEDVLSPPGGPRNFYLTDNSWLSHREDAKLMEGLRMLAIEKRSYPFQEKLLDAKTSEEKKAIRKQIKALKDLKEDELFADLEMSDNDWYSINYTQFNEQKTMGDCRLRWENHLRPSVYRGPWSKEEEKRLVKVANQHQCTDWQSIAEEIGTNRTAFACLKHYQQLFNRNSLQKQQWTPEIDKLLREAVGKYGEKNWRAVADYVGHGFSHSQCLHRWFNSTNPTIKKGRWSENEDELLKEAIKTHGNKWSLVACMVPSRTPTQCRERWVNVLDTNLNRGKWEPEEDQRLITICRKYDGGSIPWAKVAQELGGRTDAMCSFRWRSLSSTPEVVQQYARRVAEKVLTKKSNLSANDIVDQDMLPEACVQQVEEYKDRLINFKSRRRKSSICPSPVMILRARGEHIFPEDTSSNPTSSTRSTASPLVTKSRSASRRGSRKASSSRRGVPKSGAGQTQTKKRRKRKKSAESAPNEEEGEEEGEQPPPPRKKRAYRRRARVLNVDDNNDNNDQGGASISTTTTAGAGPSHRDDMMQLTEQFAEQHYRNMLSQAAPTLPLLTQQQLAGMSLSWMGIPILMGRSDATLSVTPQARPFSVAGLQIPPPAPLTRPSCTSTSITSPSPSVTSQSQATSTMSWLSGVQMPPGLQLPHAFPLTMPLQALPLIPQSLQGLSFPTAPNLTRSSMSHITCTSPHSLTTMSHPTTRQRHTSVSSNSSNTASSSTPPSTVASPTCTTPSSTAPTVSSHSQIHVTSSTTMLTSRPSPIQTSPTTPTTVIEKTTSSPTVTTNSSEVSRSQDSVHGQVSQGQTPSLSTRSQASADEVVFPKGPNFITFVKRPEPVAFLTRRLRTVPSSPSPSSSSSRHPSTNTVSSYVQPHASLLAPEFRQSNLSRTETTTARSPVHTRTSSTSHTSVTNSVSSSRGNTPYYSCGTSTARSSVVVPSTSLTSIINPVSSPPRTPDIGRSSTSSPLNSDHPVGAAVSALLSLSDRTNSRSPSQFTTASPLPRMSYSPLRSLHQLARSFSAATSLSEGGDTITPRITSASNNISSPLATTTVPTSAAVGVMSTTQSPHAPVIITTTTFNSQTSADTSTGGTISHGTAAERSGPVVTQSRTLWEEMAYIRVMAVPDAVQCSEDLPEGSETMRLTREQTVALQKVDGPSLIGTDSNDNDVINLTDFTCEASIESNISHDRSSGSVGRVSLHSTTTTSPRTQTSSRKRSSTASNNEVELQYQQPNTIGPVESCDSQANPGEEGGSPHKRQRRAAKPGRKTTTRRRTANSKRKS